jgi:alkaline phosphatase D
MIPPSPPSRRGEEREVTTVKTIFKVGFLVLIGFVWVSLGGGAGVQLGLTHGVASGDVTATSAIIWARGAEVSGSTLLVEYSTDESFSDAARAEPVVLKPESDFTAKVLLTGLAPATRYYYRVWQVLGAEQSKPVVGTFVTAPQANAPAEVRFVWSADLGGQGMCRRPEYFIFNHMAEAQPDFFLFLGDTVYNDERCPSPPNAPGSDFIANTLEEYRAKQKYQFADKPYQKARAATSLYVIWDDHEVINNFAGTTVDPARLAIGRQVLFEYFPITVNPQDPNRLYRSFRWGQHVEVFILDTRQYRSDNRLPDGPNKTMLGKEQLAWLKESLQRSDATWKFIASTVKLSFPSDCPEACDSWANGASATGFERELIEISDFILANNIKNVVWLTGDEHLIDVIQYDPNRDRVIDYYEFTAGPLSALTSYLGALDETLNPTRIFASNQHWNFGQITVFGNGRLTVEYIDTAGERVFRREFRPS